MEIRVLTDGRDVLPPNEAEIGDAVAAAVARGMAGEDDGTGAKILDSFPKSNENEEKAPEDPVPLEEFYLRLFLRFQLPLPIESAVQPVLSAAEFSPIQDVFYLWRRLCFSTP
ncbi:hypothetical protein DM860_005051 [Cuscuta australis]|uniref:Uncharacterized protein n=1 Tax=Cuscuta australis TaxID=267555 RepID=A0A328DM92_9ASTE|nr:hypothetical protein DM860_005051 [Cuscuta australis]